MRCAATDLDAWRHYRDTEGASLSALLAQLRRESVPTEAMLAGRAFHRALETCGTGAHGRLAADGYTFDLDLDATLVLPAIREVKATRDYRIDHHRITLVGRVDAIDGRRIDDHKLTTHWDPERFLDSYQWRVYLAVFGASLFRWNVFEARAHGPRRYVVFALHPLEMTRYPELDADLRRELAEYARFYRTHVQMSGPDTSDRARYGRASVSTPP